MKDFVGNDLVISDKVATTVNGYANLEVLKIIGFSAQKIRLEHKSGYITKFPNQVSLVRYPAPKVDI